MAKVKMKPGKLVINGEPYPATVLFITGRDKLGRPKEARFLYDEESMNIQGGEEFLVVYALGRAVAPRSN